MQYVSNLTQIFRLTISIYYNFVGQCSLIKKLNMKTDYYIKARLPAEKIFFIKAMFIDSQFYGHSLHKYLFDSGMIFLLPYFNSWLRFLLLKKN